MLADDLPSLLSDDPYDATVLARLWGKTELRPGPLEEPCRIWTGTAIGRFGGAGKPRDNVNRYGRISYRGGSVTTHRLAYELLVGPVPSNRQVHHRCEVTLCWEPAHLQAVTSRENLMASDTPAARNAAKEVCSRAGHPLSGDNVRIKTFKGGRQGRACRACELEVGNEWRNANRERVNAQRRIREGRARPGDEALATAPLPVRS